MFLLASTLSLHHCGLWLSTVQDEQTAALAAAPREERRAVRARYRRQLRARARVRAAAAHRHLADAQICGIFQHQSGPRAGRAAPARERAGAPPSCCPSVFRFYTLQAAGYLIDVYRGTVRADRNLGRLALFLGFFPQIMEGPICRYDQTAHALWEGRPLCWQNITFGMQRILFGFFKKIVIADRLNILIQNVFAEHIQYDGGVIALAMVCYTCQLYMEFSGTMDVVIGSAEMFGVRLPENFRQPFFAQSIQEFWMRWHITLGAWLRDYVFYPLSLSGPLKKLTGAAPATWAVTSARCSRARLRC